MAASRTSVALLARDFYGSRLRCLMLTHQPDAVVARLLTELIEPFGVVEVGRDYWMPRGFLSPDEARLGESPGFLSSAQQQTVTTWWLAEPRYANTPNWDIASTCTIDDRPGLVLVEAKAYSAELSSAGKSTPRTPNGLENHDQITHRVAEASRKLNALLPGFSLSASLHYQLCNRLVWSWKVATLGVPVVLVYLGFLNAEEMAHRGRPFGSVCEWEGVVREQARGIVPDAAWDRRLDMDGTPIIPLIRTMALLWSAPS